MTKKPKIRRAMAGGYSGWTVDFGSSKPGKVFVMVHDDKLRIYPKGGKL